MTAVALEALLAAAPVEAGGCAALARYGALVLEQNRRFNLTGAKSPAALAPHILDSLTVSQFVRHPYVDIGSGAGLPAIPLAIANSVAVTMIESAGKKARFLQSALTQLDLPGSVVAERAEVVAHRPELREQFASGTARAVGTAPTVAELLLPFIGVGGAAILQRGAISPRERRALEDAALMLGARLESEIALDGERRLLVLRKLAATPARFPRRPGVPNKRPLCL